MAVFNFFSKRQKQANGPVDVYQYDSLPSKLRVQIVHILQDMIGRPNFSDYGNNNAANVYIAIVSALRRELGKFKLVSNAYDAQIELLTFLTDTRNLDELLDAIEAAFLVGPATMAKINWYTQDTSGVNASPNASIDELNTRFRENEVGYYFGPSGLIRMDSEMLHAEAVVPTLSFLSTRGFEGANEEFLSAHHHYRQGKFDDAIVNAARAYESTMKSICAKRGWDFDKNATAKQLLHVLLKHQLFPIYLEHQMGAVTTLLETGVATVRNKTGAHGSGPAPNNTEEWFTKYALNLSATTILFLADAHEAKS